MLHDERRLIRHEANWRLFRRSSMLAASVILVILLVLDANFGFASAQLNITIVLVAICLFVLFKLDYWIHRLTRALDVRRREEHSTHSR